MEDGEGGKGWGSRSASRGGASHAAPRPLRCSPGLGWSHFFVVVESEGEVEANGPR